MRRTFLMTTALTSLLIATAGASAANLPGSFPGVTIDAKLIGGQQYEPLYARIAEWEKLTGAKVNVISKKNGFDLDKEIKSDIASGAINWCVGWNHTSFAPQFTSLYTDLTPLIPAEEIAKFVPSNIKAATIGGKLEMLPRVAVRRLSDLLSEEPLHRRSQEVRVQGQIRLRSRAAQDLQGVLGPGDLLRQPAEFLRHAVRRQGRGITGRFYEMLVAEGGQFLDDKGKPAFNSDAGVQRARLVRQPLQGQGRAGRARPTISGTISARALPPERSPQSRLAGLGDVLQ